MTARGEGELSVDEAVRLRTTAESLHASGHAVVALDAVGRVTAWNERAAALSGWSAEAAVGHALYDRLVGQSRLSLAEGLSLLSVGQRWEAELDLEGPRGKPLHVEVSADPVRLGESSSGSVLVLRPLESEDLERRMHELATALRLVPDAVVVVDAQALIREWNPAAEAMFGWSRTVVLGAPVQILVPEEARQEFEQIWNQLVAGTHVPPYETRRLDSDGKSHLVSVHTAPILERGVLAGAVATFRELSARQADERLLSGLIAELPVVVTAYDEHSRVIFAAGGGCLRAGISPTFAPDTTLLSALPNSTRLHEAVKASLTGQMSQLQAVFDDRVWQCHVAPTNDGGFLSAFDITGEHVLNDRLDTLLSAAPLAFVTFDASGRTTFAAGSVFTEMAFDPEDLFGLNLLEMFADSPQISQALLRCLAGHHVDLATDYRGRVWDLHYRCYRDSDGSVTGGVCIAQDASSWVRDRGEPGDDVGQSGTTKPANALLERDPLTGLPGQRTVVRRLNEPIADGLIRAVALIDLDDFPLLNHEHSADGTDVVLQVIAGRLLTGSGTAFLGRWTHTAFIIVLDAATANEDLSALLEQLTAAVSAPVSLATGTVHLNSTTSTATTLDTPASSLLNAAEQNLQQARTHNGTQARWTREPTRSARPGGVLAVAELQTALADDQLQLHFQPIMAVEKRKPVAVEALIRWQHPSEGLLSPAAFVPLAERSGLIHDLGRWTTRRSCEMALLLEAQGTPLRVAMNVSAPQLVRYGLTDMIVEVLAETGCPATSLTIEITETALTADLDRAVTTLQQLANLGIGLALDDFGTGYSSLLYLRRFPVDTLKIDRSFIAGLGISQEDTAIVASTISLAHNIGVQCVAEGVETLSQLELLSSMGCDLAQGYLFSRALPAPQLASWLSEPSGLPEQALKPPSDTSETEKILRLHKEGASLHTIAGALNLGGQRTPRGTRWTATTVAQVIAQRVYPT